MKMVIKNGRIQAIAPDDLGFLEQLGLCTVRRASHVEPVPTDTGTQWAADLSPVGGPMLGPYRTRSEALAAELAWLEPRLGNIQFHEESENHDSANP
jgi:hypothetical protein